MTDLEALKKLLVLLPEVVNIPLPTEQYESLRECADHMRALVEQIEKPGASVNFAWNVLEEAGTAIFLHDDLEGFRIQANIQKWDIEGITDEQIRDAFREFEQCEKPTQVDDALDKMRVVCLSQVFALLTKNKHEHDVI